MRLRIFLIGLAIAFSTFIVLAWAQNGTGSSIGMQLSGGTCAAPASGWVYLCGSKNGATTTISMSADGAGYVTLPAQGPQGPQGATGPQGPQGIPGPTGPAGATPSYSQFTCPTLTITNNGITGTNCTFK